MSWFSGFLIGIGLYACFLLFMEDLKALVRKEVQRALGAELLPVPEKKAKVVA